MESSYSEQVNMMKDFIWLVDLNTRFRDLKYIIRVTPDTKDSEPSNDIIQLLDTRQEIQEAKTNSN